MFNLCCRKFKTLCKIIKIKYRTISGYILALVSVTNIKRGVNFKITQRISISGNGFIDIGDCVSIGVYPSPGFNYGECYLESRSESAIIVIGNNVIINNNAVIICDRSRIEIGSDTLIGFNFSCFDSNFHSLAP